MISNLFDKIEIIKNKREFLTHTGYYKNKKISVISTGIGTDNIDIVINELDSLVNIDLKQRQLKEDHKSLNFIRIGTCGSIQEEIEVNSFIVSDYGLGFDNLLRFYKCHWTEDEKLLYDKIKYHLQYYLTYTPFYLFGASELLKQIFSDNYLHGITVTSPGFFGPQGRELRLDLSYPELIKHLASFSFSDIKILNFEMETSAIYGLSKLLGHQAITIDLVLANRITKIASSNYSEKISELALSVLERIVQYDL